MCVHLQQPRYIGYYLSIELFASNRADNIEVDGLVRFATSHFTSSNDIVFSRKKVLIPALFRGPTFVQSFQHIWAYTFHVILILQAHVGKSGNFYAQGRNFEQVRIFCKRIQLAKCLKIRKFCDPSLKNTVPPKKCRYLTPDPPPKKVNGAYFFQARTFLLFSSI